MRGPGGAKTALAVVAAAVVGLAAVPAEARLAVQSRGFDVGQPGDAASSPKSLRDLVEAKKLGADSIRLVIRWSWLSRAPRSYAGSRVEMVDKMIERADDLDLDVVATTLNTPCWATDERTLGRCSALNRASAPRRPGDYRHFIALLARRWGDRLEAIEVWNEPNRPPQWRGTPGQYVELVRAARSAIHHSRNPGVKLVAGSLAGSDTAYLQRLYDSGLRGVPDAISIHPYDLNTFTGFGNPTRPRPGDPTSFAAGVPAIRSVMRQNGDTSPLWITEFGVASCPALPACASADVQASYLQGALELAAHWKYVDVFLIYRLRDSLGSAPLYELTFGVLRRGWQPKPAAGAIRRTFASLRRASRR